MRTRGDDDAPRDQCAVIPGDELRAVRQPQEQTLAASRSEPRRDVAGESPQFRVADLAVPEPDGDGLAFLGNAGEPFDIEGLDAIELPNPPFSFAALFNARKD